MSTAVLRLVCSPSAPVQYADSAYVFVGGLPFDLTEGDVLVIMSQFGEIVDCNLVRDRETGESKGCVCVCERAQNVCACMSAISMLCTLSGALSFTARQRLIFFFDARSLVVHSFAFVAYADQRSTVLAVDNFTGATVLGRMIRCDHVPKYRIPKVLLLLCQQQISFAQTHANYCFGEQKKKKKTDKKAFESSEESSTDSERELYVFMF